MDQRTSSSGGGNSAAARQLSSGSTIPYSAGLPPRSPRRSCRTVWRRRHGGERDCTPGAELPDCHRATPAGGVLRELNCRRSFPAAPAGVLREQKSLAWVALRQSGSSAPGVQSLSPRCLLLQTASHCLSGSSGGAADRGCRDCTPGAEPLPSSPRRSCSPLVHKILAML